jgi:ribonuclease P protein component
VKHEACLPKNEIIKNSREFSRIIENGKNWRGKWLRIYFEEGDKRQVGFAVSKRQGNAVQRNRIKRLLREVYRKKRSWIGNCKMILMTKQSSTPVGISDLEQDFNRFLNEKIRESS